MLGATSVDDLARDHLEAAPLAPVPATHVAAIQPDHDGAGPLRHGLVPGLNGVRLHDLRTDAQRPVAHRAGVPRPAERQQLGQKSGDPAERRQRRVPGRHVGQLGRDRVTAEVESGEAPHPPLSWRHGQASRRRTRIGTPPNRKRNRAR